MSRGGYSRRKSQSRRAAYRLSPAAGAMAASDPILFDTLAEIVTSNRRNIQALETANLLPGALFASEVIPTDGLPAQRKRARHKWFVRIKDRLADADLVFVDPDNGIEPAGFSYGSSKAGKSVLLSELRELAKPGRCLIVYHHHTRRKGGHHAEMAHCG